MCMNISESRKIKLNSEGYHIGWKIVTYDNYAPYCWIHTGYLYKVGENTCCRDYPLTDAEKCLGEIRSGFHIYQTRQDARKGIKIYIDCCDSPSRVKIIKVYFKPEDIVAFGNVNLTDIHISTKNLVIKKLTIKSLKGE